MFVPVSIILKYKEQKYYPAVLSWLVERLLHKKCHLLTAVRIPLGTHDLYSHHRNKNDVDEERGRFAL